MVNETDRPLKIVILGSGNVAWNLAPELDKVAEVVQVYSKHLDNASRLASRLRNAGATDTTDSLRRDADLYLIAVKDDAIAGIVDSTADTGGVWAHTSGSVGMEVFEGKKSAYGVFYPLQTFNKTSSVDLRKVPFFIEADNEKTYLFLESVASMISERVEPADSSRRGLLHRAAVFGCNFVNYLWSVADDILKTEGLDITVLEPLLRVTLENALQMSPGNAQTGPARRNDREVIDRHISLLPPEKARLYRILTDCILDKYKEKNE